MQKQWSSSLMRLIGTCCPSNNCVHSTTIWKILGCCGNAKGHCRNAPCNSSIAAMMQQREHCGNALQYCGNTYCGNAEGHCKQHQHCSNIAAIRALKQALRQYAEALQQHRHCRNALRHCSNTGIAAMRWGIAAIPHCGNAMPRCCSIATARFLWRGLPVVPPAPRCCGGAVSFCWKGRKVIP